MVAQWVTVLVLLLATTLEARDVSPTLLLESSTNSTQSVSSVIRALRVFENGSFKTAKITIQKSHPSAPPQTLLLVSPNTRGVYPILLFVPSALVQNSDYSELLGHIASHGYVVVAPQAWSIIIPSHSSEIEMAASVVNWLSTNLQKALPENVQGDPSMLAVSGHGRGAKTAFALALGISKTTLKVPISALIGVDPVAGSSKQLRTKPYILTYEPNSFDLFIPTMVIATGLGNQSKILFGPACAPNQVNYEEFFNECKSGTQFVVSDYGHLDLLNDNLSPQGFVASAACVKGKGAKDLIRRTIGGLIVAYLDSSFLDEPSDYVNIITNPSLAPAKLDPIKTKTRGDGTRYYSQA